tara:strand:- start:2622 stop:2873 length:252 start_codon:yes stop_codon:yes gene_type:complete
MMTETLKSTIRHILTALGVLLGVFGLGQFTGIIEIVNLELDSVWSAIQTIIGFALTVYGYFKDSARHEERVVGAPLVAKLKTK